MRKIKANLEGVRKMSRLPGVVVVVDARKEYLALREAKKLGITTIGVIDTDSDPDTVDVAIAANDDSTKAIDLILNELADAVAIGKTMVAARPEPRARPRRVRSTRSALARADEGTDETAPAVEEPQEKAVEKAEEQAVKEPQEKAAEEPQEEAVKLPSEESEGEGETVPPAAVEEPEEEAVKSGSEESEGEEQKPEQSSS